MSKWVIEPVFLTATGKATQWVTEDGELFAMGATRISGPNDSQVPRRLLGKGGTRARARRSLTRLLNMYDPLHQVVSSRERTTDAVV